MMSMLKIQRSNELLLFALMFVLCVFGNNCVLFAQPQRISAATAAAAVAPTATTTTTTTIHSSESAGASQSTNATTAQTSATANKAAAAAAAAAVTNGAIIKEKFLVNTTTTITTNSTTAAAANQKPQQQQTHRKKNGESSVALESSEADGADKQPTTYRPGGRQPSIAPHNSAQERERKLMNVLAARRSALHRGGFRTRIGTTGRTATAAAAAAAVTIETTSKSPTDPRSVCIRNCTKNFTRRTTASCMRQCANFSRMTTNANANANGPTIFVRPSSKTGGGEAPVERDTNEILFSDESSHGLFVVAKEQNDTVNHIPDTVKPTSSVKVRTRGKPAAAQTVTLATTSIEDDDMQPYVYFGQKLPPIRPGALTITAVSDEHPRLLEVSVAPSSTPALLGATATPLASGTATTKRALTAVERSRSHYKYNMRKAAPQSFNRQRYVGSGRPTVGLNDKSAEVKAVLGNVNASEEATTVKPKMMVRESVAAMKMALFEAPNPELVVKPASPTPLIISVLSEEEEATTLPNLQPKIMAVSKNAKVVTSTASIKSATTTTTTKSTTTSPTTSTTTTSTTTTSTTTPATSTTTTTTTTTPASTTPTMSSTALPRPVTAPSTPTTSTTTTVPEPTPTTTATKMMTTTAPNPVPTKSTTPKQKSIIEEDTDRLRALGPSLTQKINIEDQNNLVVFCNSTADCEGAAGAAATGTTASYSKILRTLVLSSVRSTVYPPTSTMKPPTQYIGIAESAGAEPKLQQTTASTATLDISSTAVTDENEVSAEVRRMNLVNMVLSLVGLVPLVAIVVYLVRNFVLRRRAKNDEVFDVCITDQQPISPVTKIDSKHGRDEDDDEVDHHIMHQGKVHATRDANHNHRYDDVTSLASEYQEFNSSKIRLKSLLGEGNFGQVWKAEADDLSGHFGATRIVAVKTIRACSAQASLKDEASIMRKLGSHMNVVTLLGACVESEPHMLIMEYAMRGRLLSLLRAARSANNILPASVPGGRSLAPLSPRTLAGFALDIACGMEYIAERRIVHRDLAARNILLDHNGICKICDFGMSIDLDAERKRKEQEKNAANDAIRNNAQRFRFDFGSRYIIQQWQNNFGHHHHQHHNGHCGNGKTNSEKKHHGHGHGHGHGHDTIGKRHALPIRWMAPEALQYNVFTTETDIWAFGIVLWEIATLGSTPYAHLTGREVIRRVPNGLRPDLPKESRHEFYNLMSRCWHKDPGMRPSFSQSRLEITRSLHKSIDDDSAASDYMDVSGFSEDLEHGVVYFNHRISEFECEI